jgi:hypothetical protein
MRRFLSLPAVVAAAAMLTAGQAQAANWILDYTATAGSAPATAALTIDTADTLNAVGGYDITGIHGEVDGDQVTGLIANPSQPFSSYSANGWFIFDNVFWTNGAPALSNPGLFFQAASGDEYNLFSANASTYELYDARAGIGYVDHSIGTLDVSAPTIRALEVTSAAIPEPAAWTMMIFGFAAVGAVLRQRRAHLSPTSV